MHWELVNNPPPRQADVEDDGNRRPNEKSKKKKKNNKSENTNTHRLCLGKLSDISYARDALQQVRYDKKGKQCIPVMFVPSRNLCQACWTEVPDGFKAIAVGYSGKFEGIWEAGLHVHSPFKKVQFLIPECSIVYTMPVKQCPSRDNVMVVVKVSFLINLQYEEKTLLKFVYELGVDNLDKLIRTVTNEHVRLMVRSVDLNQVYDIMSGHSVVKETTESLNSRLNEYGLQVLSMAIENVSIPEEFADILSQTTEWQIKQKYEQQFHNMRMNLIENNSHQLLLKLKSETGVLLENETLATRVAAEKAEIARIEAETKKIVTILKEPNKVREIDAEYKLKIAELNAETKVQLSNMKFKGESESARILAEARAYADVKRALVTEKILRNEAKSLEYLSEAENYASSLLTSKREYDRKLKNLSTLKALAESSESGIVISGNELASLQSQMLACI